jgi:hypothetical protein
MRESRNMRYLFVGIHESAGHKGPDLTVYVRLISTMAGLPPPKLSTDSAPNISLFIHKMTNDYKGTQHFLTIP